MSERLRLLPEAGWERSVRPLRISAERLTHLLSNWRPGVRIANATRLVGGHRNTNMRVILDDGSSFVARFYASREACSREAHVLSLLRGRAPVPPVLHAQPARADDELSFLVLDVVAGRGLDDVLTSEPLGQELVGELGRAMGEALARVHDVRFPLAGTLAADLSVRAPLKDWSGFILGTLDGGRAAIRLGRSLTTRLRRLVTERSSDMKWIDESPCLVHGDFKLPNILVDRRVGAWVIGGIVDWEFAFSGPALFDVGSALRYEPLLPPGLVGGFEVGYRGAGGVLPPDWRRLARLIDLINLCDLANRERDTPVMHRDVQALVASSLAALDA